MRNSDKIKLIFNVIKKQNPDIVRKRCKLAKEAMKFDPNVIVSEKDEPDCLPTLYIKKRRWKLTKKIYQKTSSRLKIAELLKGLKWKEKFKLKKQGKVMRTIYN
jgi:hypothetical protein